MMNKKKKSNNRILLVDNEPDIALAFKIGLEDNGFIVDAFNDPQIASANFKDGLYDLLLLDIKMPKMDGFELYNEIRKVDDKVKVCFVTAFDIQKEDEEDLKDVATSLNQKPAIIRKPISIDDLVQKVKEELGVS